MVGMVTKDIINNQLVKEEALSPIGEKIIKGNQKANVP